MDNFFDYAIADEVHELKGGDTAQGNALGTLASCARHIAVLTGTLLGGYALDLFNILFRLEPSRMLEEGFEHGEAGVRAFTETYGLLEKITVIEPADNACSEARVTTRFRHRPGASPLLFGRFLMSLGAFVSLEDISDALPPYREEVVSIEMDQPLKKAYEDLEEDIKKALREHRGNQSVISVALNALLAYPDRPFGFGDLIGREFNPETQRREPFLIAATRDLDQNLVYAKERRLVEEVKASLERGRKVQVYAVYTQKRDVTRRLESILAKEGIRVAVLTTEVAPELRESWYERQLRAGVQVVIAHPRLVQTGLDLWSFPDIFFYETGYSIYTLRQASRRSWRIGQRSNVNVKFFYYAGTMQETCLRLMGKKLLVSLAMEGKFASDGLQAIDEGDDILMAMARELVTEKGIGEIADAVWKQLQRQQAEVFGVRAVETSPSELEAEPSERDVSEVIIPPPAPMPTVVTQLLMFGSSLEDLPKRKASRRVDVLLPPRRVNWVCFESSKMRGKHHRGGLPTCHPPREVVVTFRAHARARAANHPSGTSAGSCTPLGIPQGEQGLVRRLRDAAPTAGTRSAAPRGPAEWRFNLPVEASTNGHVGVVDRDRSVGSPRMRPISWGSFRSLRTHR